MCGMFIQINMGFIYENMETVRSMEREYLLWKGMFKELNTKSSEDMS